MATIEMGHDILTLINVFTVAPEKQEASFALLIEATEQTMRHLPGFISANIHKSHDGRRVVNYAQWRSRDDFDAMLKNREAVPHMKRAAELAQFDPILCEVSYVDQV